MIIQLYRFAASSLTNAISYKINERDFYFVQFFYSTREKKEKKTPEYKRIFSKTKNVVCIFFLIIYLLRRDLTFLRRLRHFDVSMYPQPRLYCGTFA